MTTCRYFTMTLQNENIYISPQTLQGLCRERLGNKTAESRLPAPTRNLPAKIICVLVVVAVEVHQQEAQLALGIVQSLWREGGKHNAVHKPLLLASYQPPPQIYTPIS